MDRDEMFRRVQQRIAFHRRGAADAAAKWLADDYTADADALEQCIKLAMENDAFRHERDQWQALAAAADADKRKAEAIAAEQAGKLERMRALLLNAYCYVVAHVPIGVKTDKDRGVLMLDIDAALKEQK
jgi:hypothetical protein